MDTMSCFVEPDCRDSEAWSAAVAEHCKSLAGAGRAAVDQVLLKVRAAVKEGRVQFASPATPTAVDFANSVLTSLQAVAPVTAWEVSGLVPASEALFVQAVEDRHFAFVPFQTL